MTNGNTTEHNEPHEPEEGERVEDSPLTLDQVRETKALKTKFILFLRDFKANEELATRFKENNLSEIDYIAITRYLEEFSRIHRRSEKIRERLTEGLRIHAEGEGVLKRSERTKQSSADTYVELMSKIDDATKDEDEFRELMLRMQDYGAENIQHSIAYLLEKTYTDDQEIFEELEEKLDRIASQRETLEQLDGELEDVAEEYEVEPEKLLASLDTDREFRADEQRRSFLTKEVKKILKKGTTVSQRAKMGLTSVFKRRPHELSKAASDVVRKKEEYERILHEIDTTSKDLAKTIYKILKTETLGRTIKRFKVIEKGREAVVRGEQGTKNYAEGKVETGKWDKGMFVIKGVKGKDRWVCVKGGKKYILAKNSILPEAGLQYYFEISTKEDKSGEEKVEKEEGYTVVSIKPPYPSEGGEETREEEEIQLLREIDRLLNRRGDDNKYVIDKARRDTISEMLNREDYNALRRYLDINVNQVTGKRRETINKILEKLRELIGEVEEAEYGNTRAELEQYILNHNLDEVDIADDDTLENIRTRIREAERRIAEELLGDEEAEEAGGEAVYGNTMEELEQYILNHNLDEVDIADNDTEEDVREKIREAEGRRAQELLDREEEPEEVLDYGNNMEELDQYIIDHNLDEVDIANDDTEEDVREKIREAEREISAGLYREFEDEERMRREAIDRINRDPEYVRDLLYEYINNQLAGNNAAIRDARNQIDALNDDERKEYALRII